MEIKFQTFQDEVLKALNINSSFKQVAKIERKNNVIPFKKPEYEVQAASQNIEESNKNEIKAKTEVGGVLFRTVDYKFPNKFVRISNAENNNKIGDQLDNFIKDMIVNGTGIPEGSFTEPDPPDFLISGKENVTKFNNFLNIKNSIAISIYIESKNVVSKSVFFSGKSSNTLDENLKKIFLECITKGINVQIQKDVALNMLKTFIFKGEVFTGEAEYLVFKPNNQNDIIVSEFDREEFMSKVASSQLTLKPITKGSEDVELILNGKRIAKFETRGKFMAVATGTERKPTSQKEKPVVLNPQETKKLEQKLDRKYPMIQWFVDKLAESPYFAFSGESSYKGFYNFLKESGVSDKQIALIKSWLPDNPKMIMDKVKVSDNEMIVHAINKNIPLSNNRIEIKIKLGNE